MNPHDHVVLLDRLRAEGALSAWRGGDRVLRRRIAADVGAGLAAVVAGLRRRGIQTSSDGDTVTYARLDGRLGVIALAAHTAPWEGAPWRSYRPLLYRFHVDHYELSPPARTVGSLRDRHRPLCTAGHGREALELTVLAAELAGFAAWLPDWIIARELQAPHSAPPAVMSREGTAVESYAWSAAARAALRAWERLEDDVLASHGSSDASRARGAA